MQGTVKCLELSRPQQKELAWKASQQLKALPEQGAHQRNPW